MSNRHDAQTVIGLAWADLLALIPASRRNRAMELALILHGEYASGEALARRDGFSEGYTAGQDAMKSAADEGYRDGWDRGRQAAVDQALARIGTHAAQPLEDDGWTGQRREPLPS